MMHLSAGNPPRFFSRRAPWRLLSLCAALCGTASLGMAQVTPAVGADKAADAKAPALHAFDPSLRDTGVDPCTDFYQYACGGWIKSHPIPADRSSYGRSEEVEDGNEQVLRRILEQAAAGGARRTPDEQKTGDAYAACMDTTALDSHGLDELKASLTPIDRLTSLDQLPALLATLHNEGSSPLFNFGAEQSYGDASEEVASMSQPDLGLPEKGYYDRTDARSAGLRDAYQAHVRRMFMLLGEPEQQAVADSAAVLRIEIALATASLSQEQMRDPHNMDHPTPLEQFVANSPELDMALFLKDVHAPAIASLNVDEPVYFLDLHDLLSKLSMEDLRAYLRWATVRSVPSTALPQSLDDERFAFYGKEMSGTPQQQPRWRRCSATVDQELGEALGRVYVEQRFSAADKARTLALTRDIEAAAARDLERLDWMSVRTKEAAENKLHLVANNIGYPDHWRDYATLNISPTDAFDNAERASAFEVARTTRKIGRPVNRGEWEMTPPTVNAFYDPQLNSVNFPAGILQPPFFDATQDNAVNFGSAGGVIGHELTHGFDDQGRQFDGHGNLRDWWRKSDAAKFADKAACVTDEYNGFTAVTTATGTLKVNGELTRGENLADLAGLRLAWLAFTEKEKTEGRSVTALDKNQPGEADYAHLTPAQQFFAAYGQSWCSNTRDADAEQRVHVDPHAPDKYRVNGVVRNMPSFAEAWSCTAGTPMAPVHRCAIW